METAERLPFVINKFRDAVHALVGTRSGVIDTDTGQRRVVGDSLYQTMRDSVAGLVRDTTGSKGWRSTPPLWLDAEQWIDDVDREVRTWHHDGTGPDHATVNRLHALAELGWRPQDAQWLKDATRFLWSWVAKADNLLDGDTKHTWSLVAACPACGTATRRVRDSAGDWVRQAALQVDSTGCVCAECETRWSPEHFALLASALGCELPEGVLE